MDAKFYSLTRDQVRELCPSCADKMQVARIKELKLSADELGNLLPNDEATIKLFAGFSQGLCDKFGGDEGFFTRCEAAMSKHTDTIEDPKPFCASLHKYCTGHWPAEKKHAVLSRAELMAQCEKDHPEWTPAQHKAWVDKALTKEYSDAGVSEDVVLSYANNIKGVEIFKTGVHNGDEYTGQDLDDMVSAFGELDYSPAIKVGHTKDAPGAPSYGWVKNLRRVGEKLYADFEDMHDSVVDAVRNRLYDRVSAEVYFNLKRGEKQFRRALKAVALLGAEVPAVADLTPLHKMQFSADRDFDAVGVFEADLDVSADTLLDTLSERISGLVNLMKEYDMANKKEQIAALKEQVAEFSQKMDELKKTKSGLSDEELEKDAEYKQLAEQADEIAAQLSELEAADADDAEETAELRQELAEFKAREEANKKEQKALADRLAMLEQKDINEKIGERVKACKIPSFRPGLEALYAYALAHTDATVKVYTKKDGKDVAEDQSLAQVVDGFVSSINEQGEKLFKAMAFSGARVREDGNVEENAGAVVQKRVSEFRLKNPSVKTYEEAMRAVLAADPELAKTYREQAGLEQ